MSIQETNAGQVARVCAHFQLSTLALAFWDWLMVMVLAASSGLIFQLKNSFIGLLNEATSVYDSLHKIMTNCFFHF